MTVEDKYWFFSSPFYNLWKWKSLSCVQLFETPWAIQSMEFSRILEWESIPFSRGSSQPRDWTQVFPIAGGFFTSWATREAQEYWSGKAQGKLGRNREEVDGAGSRGPLGPPAHPREQLKHFDPQTQKAHSPSLHCWVCMPGTYP